jgi:hypothetical protein
MRPAYTHQVNSIISNADKTFGVLPGVGILNPHRLQTNKPNTDEPEPKDE